MTHGPDGSVRTEIKVLLQSLRDSLCGVASQEDARQLQLFPFDPLATAQPVVVLSRPCAGISRSVLAPVLLGAAHTDDARVTFLLVAGDGLTGGFGHTTLAQLRNPDGLGLRLHASAQAGRDACREAADCLADWRAPARWHIACEGDAFQRQAVAAITRLNEHRIASAENEPLLLDVYDIEKIACEVLTSRLREALDWVILSLRPALSSWFQPTHSDTASRPICYRVVPTYARCKRCWVTVT